MLPLVKLMSQAPALLKLFADGKEVFEKQKATLDSLISGNTDFAIRAVYTKDTLQSFMTSTALAQTSSKPELESAVKVAAQSFVQDFISKLESMDKHIADAKDIKAKEHLGNDYKIVDGKIQSNVELSVKGAFQNFFDANRSDIEAREEFSKTLATTVANHSESIESWFAEHVLIEELDGSATASLNF